MNIAVFGKYFSNAGHGAECGIVDALRELGHKVWILDFAAKKLGLTDGSITELDQHAKIELYDCDFALVVGPGLPPAIAKQENIEIFFGSHYSVCYNSEPVRLKQYLDRVCQQRSLFTLWATFDEGEIPIYTDNSLDAIFLPQAFNPAWYKPLDVTPEGIACFVGSVGGKWQNREHMLRRAKMVLGEGLTALRLFDANKVNEIYNKHVIVLNLGLYHEELGAPGHLASYAFQQRIFEAIGAGAVPMTNTPADLTMTPLQRGMFTNHQNIIYYDNETFEATLQFYINHTEKLAEIHRNVLASREEHTYKNRMEYLIKTLERDMKWDIS
jgi:hypothetical protein